MRWLFVFLLVTLTLSACNGSTPETSTATQTPAPPPTGTSTPSPPTATVTSLPPTATLTPLPPTLTPTANSETQVEDVNADLNYAQVVFVQATQGSNGLWTFNTTVRHNDEGWDHYADAWQVVDSTGNVLAERVLAHPHDTEQPFTRSQSNIEIPPNLTTVTVRAKCNIHGFGGQEVIVDLTAGEGEGFEVIAKN